jgi:hypothetical protein
MQSITITPQLENGRHYIEMSDEFADADFSIQIIVKKEKAEPEVTLEKLEKICAFSGLASDSGIQMNKSEWYQQ